VCVVVVVAAVVAVVVVVVVVALIYPLTHFDSRLATFTGQFCFGVTETMLALAMGAINILIVWENLEVNRYSYVKLPDQPQEVLYLRSVSNDLQKNQRRWLATLPRAGFHSAPKTGHGISSALVRWGQASRSRL
jgi:hypothetical protein